MTPLTEATHLILRQQWQPMDADAAAYITAVEAADGQALEERVKIAIDNFVLGCKADGIWNAIKASCILAGARTLAGALVPLRGTAPTNFNFVAGDYNRKTGLAGDGSTKYLNSNRANNADPQNSHHYSAYVSAVPNSGGFPALLGSTPYGVTGATQLYRRVGAGDRWEAQSRNATGQTSTTPLVLGPTFVGLSRNSSSTCTLRANQASGDSNIASQAPGAESTLVYSVAGIALANARLAFYSIGEFLDLARLDSRVTDLINRFAAVIP